MRFAVFVHGTHISCYHLLAFPACYFAKTAFSTLHASTVKQRN